MLIAGGADSVFAALQDAWSYPVWFETGEWYTAPDLPAPRYGAKSGSYNSLLIIGGASDASTIHDNVWSGYDVAWETLAPFSGGPRRGGVAAGIAPDQFWSNTTYFGLGLDGNFERKKDWWKVEVVLPVPENAAPQLAIYPNPGHTQLNIDGPSSGSQHIRFMDARGTLVYEIRHLGRSPVPTDALLPGVYIVRVLLENGTQHHFRWVKL